MKAAKQIGTVSIEQIGLYLDIRCKCRGLVGGFHRLRMVFQNKTIVLGLLVREGEIYVANRKIPKKSLGNGEPEFVVVSGDETVQGQSIRLLSGQSVENLEMIRAGKLLIQNGESYLLFSSQSHRVLPDPST